MNPKIRSFWSPLFFYLISIFGFSCLKIALSIDISSYKVETLYSCITCNVGNRAFSSPSSPLVGNRICYVTF